VQSQRKNRRRTSNPLVLRTVIVFFILAAVGTILCTLPIFNVKEITTSSLRLLLPDDILRTANLPTGENIFLMRFGNAKKKLEKIQSIKKVDFHRMIPDVIQIRITERKEVAVTILDGQSTLVDDQGYIFTPTIFPDITHLPVLSGLKKAWIKEGRLSGEVGGQLIKLLSEFKNFIMPSKLQVNISDLLLFHIAPNEDR